MVYFIAQILRAHCLKAILIAVTRTNTKKSKVIRLSKWGYHTSYIILMLRAFVYCTHTHAQFNPAQWLHKTSIYNIFIQVILSIKNLIYGKRHTRHTHTRNAHYKCRFDILCTSIVYTRSIVCFLRKIPTTEKKKREK